MLINKKIQPTQKKIGTIDGTFAETLCRKNIVNRGEDDYSYDTRVFKTDASINITAYLELMVTLLNQLRFSNMQGQTNIHFLKQDVIRQIRNNITLHANSIRGTQLHKVLNNFLTSENFDNNEMIDNTITVITQELKKKVHHF